MSENNFNIETATAEQLTQAFTDGNITVDQLMAETKRRATKAAEEKAANNLQTAIALANPERKAWEQWVNNHQPLKRVYCAAKDCEGHEAEDFKLHPSHVTATSWSMDENGKLSTINLFDAGNDVSRGRIANYVAELTQEFFCEGGVLRTYPWTKGNKSAVTIRFVEKAKSETEGGEADAPKNAGTPERGRNSQR